MVVEEDDANSVIADLYTSRSFMDEKVIINMAETLEDLTQNLLSKIK